MKRIGVLLSGCGVFDGSEIHESVLVLLAIDKAGAQAVCLAPNIRQAHVVDHHTGNPAEGEARNVLVEAARIARGKVRDLVDVSADDFDALVLPGGFGAAKNLSDYAFSQDRTGSLKIEPLTAHLIEAMFKAGKPLGFCCIAPVVAAAVLGKYGVELTVGEDPLTAAEINRLGARHVPKAVTEIHRDPRHKVVSTPAYMYDARVSEVAAGIGKLVDEVVALIP